MNDANIVVDYNPALKRFLVSCSFYTNDALNTIPSRRWMKAARAWGVPVIRRNVEWLIEHLQKTSRARFTPSAIEQINAVRAKYQAAANEVRGAFPAWYAFKTEPRSHQRTCINKFYGLTAAAMHMDRGTGKTKATIDIACARRMEGKIDALLVVCKLAGRRTWQEEFEIHAPIPASVHLPYTERERAFERWLAEPHDFRVLVVGVESLSVGKMSRIAERFLLASTKVMMVIDESHIISNHRAARSVACAKLGKLAVFRNTLTGTPISTGPMNLFMQFEFLDPEIIGIGDFYAFRNRYAVMGGYRDPKTGRPMQIVGYQNVEELARTVAPYVYEVRKSDALDLPPKVYKRLYVQLTQEQRALYTKIRREKGYELSGRTVVVKNVLELALRLHQVCGGYSTTYTEIDWNGKKKRRPHVEEIVPWQKNPKVIETLDILSDDKQAIVWCPYRAEIAAVCAALRETFPNELVREIHGDISEDDRNTFKNEFQSGKAKFLVGNTATGGTSLTLTACQTMVYWGNTERLIDREQSEDRAHRDGLKHSVLYIDLIAERTVDETILKSIASKLDLSEYVRRHIKSASDLLGDGV